MIAIVGIFGVGIGLGLMAPNDVTWNREDAAFQFKFGLYLLLGGVALIAVQVAAWVLA